jgi:hypothetical protein
LTGCNGLIKLAIHILSVIANSTGCECAFSDFGIIHTKPRNKLSAEKVHKTSTLKMDIRHAHVDADFIRPQSKRVFGEIDEANSELAEPSIPDTNNSDFNKLTHRLVRDSETADGNDDSVLNFIPTICVPPCPQHANSSTMESTQWSQPPSLLISLKSLFNYSMTSNMNAEAGLDFYWKGGLKNLNQELAAYDLLCEEEEESFPDEDGMADVIDDAG